MASWNPCNSSDIDQLQGLRVAVGIADCVSVPWRFANLRLWNALTPVKDTSLLRIVLRPSPNSGVRISPGVE